MLDIRINPKGDSGTIPWEAIIGILPHFIWLAALGIFIYFMGRDRLQAILDGITKIKVGGVEIEFRDTLKNAADVHNQVIDNVKLDLASRRISRQQYLLSNSRILWVDDHPENNINERYLFEKSGATLDVQFTSANAYSLIGYYRYDLILSDIRRGDDPEAGLRFAEDIAELPDHPPLIFYVRNVDGPAPITAFGITDRPDELVHLVLDALARRRI